MSCAIKNGFSKLMLAALGRGMKGVYKLDAEMRGNALDLPNGYTVRVRALGTSAKLVFSVSDRGICIYNHKNEPLSVDLDIVFKSVEVLLPMLKGVRGIKHAFAEHDFTMAGDISQAMNVVNMITLTECYLFPNFMLKRIMSRLPKREKSKSRLYAYFILGV